MVALIVSLSALAQPALSFAITQKLHSNWPEAYEISGGYAGGHSFRVQFRQANFKARGRKVEIVKMGELDLAYVGGRPLHGVFLGWPDRKEDLKGYLERERTELVAFDVWIDGGRLQVARSQYDDLLNPNFDYNYCWAWLSKDGKKLVVKLMGADAADSYTAIWTFQDGKVVKRSISGTR